MTDRPDETTHELSTGVTPSDAIVRAVAAVTGQDPAEMDPLYGTTDPDALDRMFAVSDGDSRTDGRLVLFYAGCEVVVEDDTVSVRLSDG